MLKVLMTLLLVSSSWAGPISVLGLNSRSKAVITQIDSESYSQSILLIKQGLDQQLPQSLRAMESRSVWKLQKFSVGLGVNGEVGISPYKFGFALKQRFVYSRKSL